MRSDLTGCVFGKLTVIRFAGRTTNQKARWLCCCECGREKVVTGDNLATGNSRTCGANEHRKGGPQRGMIKHGGSHWPEYAVWSAMVERCRNKRHPSYHNYGGRGIRVCKRWQQFANFIADMGRRPLGSGLSIERIDNDGNYEPSNCKWATMDEQGNNRRNTVRIIVDGQLTTIPRLARKCGLPDHVLRGRLDMGWPLDAALTTPIRSYRAVHGS